jgi:ADP-ribosylglycohydrolase
MTNASDIVFGSLIGDALALGPHWIYDQSIIRQKLGHVKTYQAPITTYHAGKTAGDLTHYGDQTLVLLRSISETHGFDFVRFTNAWQAFWENPATHAYRDGATKATLAHLRSGAPASTSDEIAGAARIGPLFLLKWANDDALISAARAQTAFTHGDHSTLEAAEFFTRVVLALRRGQDMRTALEKTMKQNDRESLLGDWFDNAIESAASAESDASELNRHGLSCHTEDAFPGICHLLLRYPLDPTTALIENVRAGGDSAARGMVLGLVYGACVPVSTWPGEWLTDLHIRQEVDALIGKLG